MKRRVFWSILLTSLAVLMITGIVVMITVYNEFIEERKIEIQTETDYIVTAYENDGIDYLKRIGGKSKNRITLISVDGSVLYDNFADASTLDNHLNRPEVSEALQRGAGEEIRQSNTLASRTYYYAIVLLDGNILRIASSMKSIFEVGIDIVGFIVLVGLFSLIIAIITARFLTKHIVAPINTINLDNPLESKTYDELSPLIVRMDKQNKIIAKQMIEIENKQSEFSKITDNMSEALIVFGANKKALVANLSAKNMFTCDDVVGKSYLELCRDLPYIQVIEKAYEGKSITKKLEKNGVIYRLSANPVNMNNEYAVVLFAVDITESEQREQMRREFSANVSHELKTPLTSILGYAEIMANGIAKEEDFLKFTKQIYDEAKRLLLLIEDIILLSSLDEDELKKEFRAVDLYAVSKMVVSKLTKKAKEKGISLTLVGKSLTVDGIENTLYEIVFNLCDNAISYSLENGEVVLSVFEEDNHVVCSVKDNGIGISLEHKERIFERFYCVDSSHSKGTGLGLSIVKHGANLHGAEIQLNSSLGVGSEFRLVFKK